MQEIIISLIIGIGLASAVGFRVFIPMFMVSLFAYFDWVPFDLGESWTWLGSSTAVIAFGVAVIIETIGYYIPVVDNALDTIAAPAAAVAGTMMVAIQLDSLDSEFIKWALAIIAGGGTATAINGATSSGRATSTVSTAGLGNSIVSSAEIGAAGALGLTSLLSLSYPVLIVILLIGLLLVGYLIYRLFKGWGKIKNVFSKN